MTLTDMGVFAVSCSSKCFIGAKSYIDLIGFSHIQLQSDITILQNKHPTLLALGAPAVGRSDSFSTFYQ
jgi:hypothetical protein